MSPWKTAEVPLPCRGIPAGENFFEKRNWGLTLSILLAIIIKQSFPGDNKFAAVLELVDRPA